MHKGKAHRLWPARGGILKIAEVDHAPARMPVGIIAQVIRIHAELVGRAARFISVVSYDQVTIDI